MPWLPLAVGDLGVKIVLAVVLLFPYRLAIRTLVVFSPPSDLNGSPAIRCIPS